MRVGKILAPVDFSPASDRALEHARVLASAFEAQVTLYHALSLRGDAVLNWVKNEEEVRRDALAAATAALEQRSGGFEERPAIVLDSEPGRPGLIDLAVTRQVAASAPDLVVMATHARGDVGSFFLGSVTGEVLRTAHTPIFAVPARAKAPGATPYARVVLATDFSPQSDAALPHAHLLARTFGSEVVVVHVKKTAGPAPDADLHDLSGEMPTETRLRKLLESFDGIRVTPRVEQGVPWHQIIGVAAEVDAGAIVMATRGADSFGDRILGSQTDRVIRGASCPVLAVPVSEPDVQRK